MADTVTPVPVVKSPRKLKDLRFCFTQISARGYHNAENYTKYQQHKCGRHHVSSFDH